MAVPDGPPTPARRVEFDLRSDDIRATIDLLATDSADSWRWAKQMKRSRLRAIPIAAAVALLAPIGLFALINRGLEQNAAGLVVGVLAAIAVWISMLDKGSATKRYREAVLRLFDEGSHDAVTGGCSVEISTEGVAYQTTLHKSLNSWSAVRCVRVTESAILIGVRERRMIVIPATAFERPSEFHAFGSEARSLLEAAGGGDAGLLRRFLVEHDLACPGCGYNLRGGLGESCPECRAPLDWMTLRQAAAAPDAGVR